MLSQDEIDSLLSNISVGVDVNSLVAQAEEESIQKNYKIYNFRRPDKFSKDHLRALQSVYESFARSLGMVLTAYLRLPVDTRVVSVDQLTYDEFVRSMPSPLAIHIIEMEPLPGQIMMGFAHEVTSSILDRILGGPGEAEKTPRELTDIEQSLTKKVAERMMQCMEEAWDNIQSIKAKIVRFEENYSLIQIAAPGEIVALITMTVDIGEKTSGLMSICIPFPVLETVVGQLSSQHIFNRTADLHDDEMADMILYKLRHAQIPVQVFLGGTIMPMREFLSLNQGDVVMLNRGAHQPMLVCLNDRPKYYAVPGTVKDHLAVSITESVCDEEAISGFYLHPEDDPILSSSI